MINSESNNSGGQNSMENSGNSQSENNSFPSSGEDNGENFQDSQGRDLLVLQENSGQKKKIKPRYRGTNQQNILQKNVFHEIAQNNDEDGEEKKNLRQVFDKFFSIGHRTLHVQMVESFSSAIFFIFYIVCTYKSDLFKYLNYLDILIILIYLADYLIKIILAHHRIAYVLSLDSLINIYTTIPSIFAFIPDDPFRDSLYQLINIARVFRVLRIFRIFSAFKNEENDVSKQVVNIINTLLQLIVISAGIMQIVEYTEVEKHIKLTTDPLQLRSYKMRTKFHHYIYFTVVTCTTVGYGDISPLTPIAKVMFMILVLLIIVLIPYQINDLIQLMNSQSDYARHSYKASRDIPHIVITGDISLDSLKSFSQELFHPDHGSQYRHAVIINTEVPTREMELFLNEKTNENFIFYLQGDPLNERDLLRADLPKAKACIIFNNKNSKDPYSGDHQSLFLGIFIKKFVYNYNMDLAKQTNDADEIKDCNNTSFHLCMQLNKPDSSCHYFNTLQQLYKQRMKQDQLIIIESIKMNLLSKSCLTPGIMALITNLVMSSGDLNDNNEAEWMKEYAEGRGHEIYRIQLQNYYKKMTFLEVVSNVYSQALAIVFALEIEVHGVSILKLNPSSTLKISELISRAKDLNSGDKTKESRGGTTKQDNSMNSEIIYSKDKMSGSMDNKVRIYAYLICSDKSVADSIANKERYMSGCEHDNIDKKSNQPQDSIYSNVPHNNKNDKENSNSILNLNNNNNTNTNNNNTGVYIPSDSDSEEDNESDNEEMMQFGSSDLDINRNDYYFNSSPDHYLRNNIEIMHHSIKDREDITNHIIICGLHPALVHFILPLRAKYLQEDALKWIVILAPNLPQHLFESFTKFSRIIFIQGSPLLPENLFRANILNADKAVILSSGESKVIKNLSAKILHGQLYSEEQMLDAETIFIYKAIKKCNKNIQIMTELICTNNIEYLLNTSNLQKLFYKQDEAPQYEFTPLYASGEVFTPSIIDRITCQSYYNPHIVTIIELILGGEKALSTKKSKKLDEFFKLGGSNLYLAKIPEAYINESFGEFFYFLIRHHHSIGIALYRKNMIEGYYYVYTNPKKTTLLRDCDFVFVLASSNNILDLVDEKPCMENNEEESSSYSDDPNTSEIDSGDVEDNSKNENKDTRDENNNTVTNTNTNTNINDGDLNNKSMMKKQSMKVNRSNKKKHSKMKDSRKSFFNDESLINQINKFELKKKQMESSKHAEIEKLQNKLDSINTELKNIKDGFSNLPDYIDEVIDKEMESEMMVYLSKN